VHVLVATDGNLDPEAVAGFAAPLAGSAGKVTVLTVIAIPRRLLSDLRGVFGERSPADVEGDAEYVGMTRESGTPPTGWPGDKEMIERYLSDKKEQRCAPVAAALSAAGVAADTRVVESEKISKTILEECARLGADLIIIGSHGEGRFEGLLGSTGTKIARHATSPLLLLRSN
jgi:nucleotide-binding universal stress UspA family protein